MKKLLYAAALFAFGLSLFAPFPAFAVDCNLTSDIDINIPTPGYPPGAPPEAQGLIKKIYRGAQINSSPAGNFGTVKVESGFPGARTTADLTIQSRVSFQEAIADKATSICIAAGGGGGGGAGGGSGGGGVPTAAGKGIKESCKISRNIEFKGEVFEKGDEVDPGTSDNWGAICLLNTVNSATNLAFFILISLSFVFIVGAGFLWVTAGTNSEKQKQAGKMIAAALIGIVIAIMARIIPGIVVGIVG